MANPEHLDILKQGVEVWNQWREEHPEIVPDLSSADLSLDNLSGFDLTDVNLSGSELASALIIGADLYRSNLMHTNLFSADCSYADFTMANLTSANLTNVTLHNTDLYETIRADWIITGVQCHTAYWGAKGKTPTHYEPGEFERLHAHVPTVELRYEGGVHPVEYLTLPLLLKHLEKEFPGSSFELSSLHTTTGKSAAVTISDRSATPHNMAEVQQVAEEFRDGVRANGQPMLEAHLAAIQGKLDAILDTATETYASTTRIEAQLDILTIYQERGLAGQAGILAALDRSAASQERTEEVTHLLLEVVSDHGQALREGLAAVRLEARWQEEDAQARFDSLDQALASHDVRAIASHSSLLKELLTGASGSMLGSHAWELCTRLLPYL